MRILFVADAVGMPGRRALEGRLASLRAELQVDFCILNGENLADGVGITPKLAERMLASGVDAITLGNHVWRRGEIVPYLKESDRVVSQPTCRSTRPAEGSRS
jgi:2',3'-cyclic-nucleotide 2'-phosphodiesterase